MPLPNIDGAGARQNNFVSSPSQEQTFDQYMLRLDHTFNQKWSVFYRHFLQDNTDFNPFQGSGPAGYLGFPTESNSRTQHATFAVNTALSSSLLNELRVGRSSNNSVSRNLPLLNPKDFGINYDRNQETAGGLGLPGHHHQRPVGDREHDPGTDDQPGERVADLQRAVEVGRAAPAESGRRVPAWRRRFRSRASSSSAALCSMAPIRATRSRTSCLGAPSSSTTRKAAPSSRCGTRTSARFFRTTSSCSTT